MVNSKSYFSLNGQPVVDHLPLSLLSDRGLAYGHGLFETILLHQSELPLIDRHLSRLVCGANILNIPVKSTLIEQYLNLFLEQLESEAITDGVVKVVFTAGVGGRGYEPPSKIEPTIICSYSALPRDIAIYRKEAIAVRYCQHRLPTHCALAGIKHLNRLDQVLARNEWSSEKFQEGLMFNASDHLVEAISANVFMKNIAGDWITPCLKHSGVSGVMRSLLMEEIFPACDIPISVAQITKDQLAKCQQLVVCNSVKGLMPVHSIYNHREQLVKSLLIEPQTLMLSETLTALFPPYR